MSKLTPEEIDGHVQASLSMFVMSEDDTVVLRNQLVALAEIIIQLRQPDPLAELTEEEDALTARCKQIYGTRNLDISLLLAIIDRLTGRKS